MADTGYSTPIAGIITKGKPPIITQHNVGTVADCYPGRLVVLEDTDYDVKIGDGLVPPLGWLGWEQADISSRPANIESIYTVDREAPICRGGGFSVYGKLVKPCVAVKGDLLCSWSTGRVAACEMIDGLPAIKIPFSKNSAAKDTGLDLVGNMFVAGCLIKAVTVTGSATIDVGIISASESGDEDGFLDGESCATDGYVVHNTVDATSANLTMGDYLIETEIKSADGTALYYQVPVVPGYECDGTKVSVEYTTSNHTVAGYILLSILSPGVQVVGRAGAAADASSADVDIHIESIL